MRPMADENPATGVKSSDTQVTVWLFWSWQVTRTRTCPWVDGMLSTETIPLEATKPLTLSTSAVQPCRLAGIDPATTGPTAVTLCAHADGTDPARKMAKKAMRLW